MKRVFVTSLALLLFSATVARAENYVKPDQFKQWMETAKPLQIVDIQPPEEFEKHHFKSSIQTSAFPAKSDEEKAKLDRILPALRATKDDVVVICPRGGGGAKNTYEHLKSKGISEERLFILEKGVEGWPYKELFVQGK